MIYILMLIIGLGALVCVDEIDDAIWNKIGA